MSHQNTNTPSLTIIIVNYHSWDKLKPCLESLSEANQPDIILEIQVVDNDPNDPHMADFARHYPQVNFVKNIGNHGFAHGCNTGALHATASVLLFLNPDTRVPKQGLKAMLERFASLPQHSILASDKKKPNGKSERIQRFFPRLFVQTGLGKAINRLFHKKQLAETFSKEQDIVYPDWVSGSVVMISRSTFARLNGWDTQFWMYSEDADLCKRASLLGGKIALAQQLIIEHDHGASSRINPVTTALTKTEVKISHHVFVSKHFRGLTRMLMHIELLVFDTLGTALWAIISILAGTHPKAKAKRLLLVNLLQYYGQCLRQGHWLSPRSVGKETRIKPESTS